MEVSFFFVGTFCKPPKPLDIVVLHLLQLCTQGGQLRKCWVEARWDVGVEDRQAKEEQESFFVTLCNILLNYKILGGNEG